MPVRGRTGGVQPLGLPVVNMGFNELPWPPPPKVAAALENAAKSAQSYGSPFCDDLRAALGGEHGLDPDHVICANGSEELLDVIARTFARPGDEILISEFGYIQFALCANRVGATLVKVPERDFTTDIDGLLAAVTDRTKVLFLANPNNPTGTMVPVADLARLADDLPPHVVLVLDLAYGEFADTGYCRAVHDLVANHENVVVTRTFSKAFGLAGVRVGWAHGPAWILPALYATRAMGPVNALAQAAGCAALDDMTTVRDRIAATRAERARVTAALEQRQFQVLPSHTNFLLISPPDRSPETAEAMVVHLFDAAGLIVGRTREAGLERFFRVSLSLREHNDLMLKTLDDLRTQSG
jgi:histidinol-phosphate aminotransferase